MTMTPEQVEKEIEALKANCQSEIKFKRELHQLVIAHDGELKHLKQWQNNQNGSLRLMSESMINVAKDINEIKVENAKGKPSWTIVFILAALSSFASAAVMYAIKLSNTVH